jgi:hypothetical protein
MKVIPAQIQSVEGYRLVWTAVANKQQIDYLRTSGCLACLVRTGWAGTAGGRLRAAVNH